MLSQKKKNNEISRTLYVLYKFYPGNGNADIKLPWIGDNRAGRTGTNNDKIIFTENLRRILDGWSFEIKT